MTEEAEDDGGLDSLLSRLDAVAAAHREATIIRRDTAPRIPRVEDMEDLGWHPPPSRAEVAKAVAADCCRHFKTTVKAAGDLFTKSSEAPLLKPKVLTAWETDRLVKPDRSISNPPDAAPLKFRFQSEPLPDTNHEQLHPLHRKWMKKHLAARDRHVHAVYHAMEKVKKCEEKEREIQRQRELTRDLMTKSALVQPKFSEKAKAGLRKAHRFATSTRALNQLKGIDNLKIEENKHKEATLRAKSAPALQFKEPTPRHRARHLRRWDGPDRRSAWTDTDRCLRQTTPWIAQDEEHEVKVKDPKLYERCKSR